MLDRELQYVEDGVRNWMLVVKARLTRTMEGIVAIDRVAKTAFQA